MLGFDAFFAATGTRRCPLLFELFQDFLHRTSPPNERVALRFFPQVRKACSG
jgi:hypothetical protein